jgi:hypothetical protein
VILKNLEMRVTHLLAAPAKLRTCSRDFFKKANCVQNVGFMAERRKALAAPVFYRSGTV